MRTSQTSPPGSPGSSALTVAGDTYAVAEEVEEVYPALPAQQGLIFHNLLASDPGVDLVQIVIEVDTPIQHDEFRRAWTSAVERHPILRTAFRWRGDDPPSQVVYREASLSIEWHDTPAETAPPANQDNPAGTRPSLAGSALERLILTERLRGFDPERAPLCRVAVLRQGSDRHVVVFNLHHAILDGRSVQILLHEVFTDYRARCGGEPASFPLRRPYREFVRWWIRQDLTAAREYWTRQLSGFAQPAPLDFGHGPGAGTADVAASGSEVADALLPEPVTAALRDLAHRTGATINTIAQAAWALVLSRFTGQADLVIGIVRTLRSPMIPGADTMVGMTINTLPLRVVVDPDLPLTQWLSAVHATTREVREHQVAPLAAIHSWCAVPSGTPLFESVVAYEHVSLEAWLRRSDRLWSYRVTHHRHPSQPITLYFYGESQLRFQVMCDRRRFPEGSAARLRQCVTSALSAMASARTDARVENVAVIEPSEYARLVNQYSGATRVSAPEGTIASWFAAQAHARPEAPALTWGDTTISYAELDRRSNQLAHVLTACAVTTDTPVGVALPRSIELVVALLAILKAGGAYVALDPANPAARNAAILAGSGAALVLSDGAVDGLPATVLTTPELLVRAAAAPTTAPVCPATPESLAYVSYTSGSTGTPKGVAIPHRAVIRLIRQPNFVRLSAAETILHMAPVAFDASTLELWGGLLTGARLVLAPPGPLDLAELATTLREHRVSTLWLTAGVFHQLVESGLEAVAGVSQLLAGGDVLSPEAVRTALRAHPDQILVNGYGPTENTTFTCCYPMAHADQVDQRVPVGRPVQDTTVYLLDPRLRPVPVGAVGELYTGGHGLARGYLNRPDLTAERFVPDPFTATPGARLYRTGDRARWRADGLVEFLGRVDDQTKIRGYRTEPGETESVLRQHPHIADAVVTVHGDDASRQLVAYIVARPDSRSTVAELPAFAADRLPEHMCPATYIDMPRLPLNANGKVDRAALPAPAPATGRDQRPHATPTQTRLAGLWQDLLGTRTAIGPDDSFFALGGNSLTATRLAFRIREEFAVSLPVRQLFVARTLAACAAAIDSAEPDPRHHQTITRGRWRTDPSASGSTRPRPVSGPPAGHLMPLSDGWAVWRWVGLRSAGFPIDTVVELAQPGCAAAAATLLAARAEAETARQHLGFRLRQAAAGDPPEAVKNAQRRLRKSDLSAALHAALATPALPPAFGAGVLASGRSALIALDSAEAAYRKAFAEASQDRTARLHALANNGLLREAVAWQNRHALRTGIDAVAKSDPTTVTRSSQYRQHEALVARYVQRYAAKNDTIGFFGPVGWALLREQPQALCVTPGPRLLAARTVYLEEWCVGALADRLARDSRLRPWLRPRAMPMLHVADGCLHLPLAPAIPLAPLVEATLSACDGVRTAADIATAVLATPAGAGRQIADVYDALNDLGTTGRIVWTLEIPTDDMHPDRALRDIVARIDDENLRNPAELALAALESARDLVAAAAGEADPLAAAIERLETTFTSLTGAAPTRRDGRFGSGRTLVYEDCRRDVTVTIAPRLIASLEPALTLLLESARWFVFAGGVLFRHACEDIYRRQVARSGHTRVPFADFWLWVNDLFLDESTPLVRPVTRALHERWARILATPPGQRRVRYTAADLREPVRSAFAVPQSGWTGSGYHSPDVMIAASSPADIDAGQFEWVIGEIHPGVNTLSSGVFVSQHPSPDELRRASIADLPGPRVTLAASRSELGAPLRITSILSGANDVRLIFAKDTVCQNPAGTLTVGSCTLDNDAGHLVVRSRDGRHTFELLDVLADMLVLHLLQRFRIAPAADHSPRVTIDNVVVSRESWSFGAGELGFARDSDEARRYLRARQWHDAHTMPRYVFVHTSAEGKPFFVDFDSLASVDVLARALRRAVTADARVTVTEMLPTPDQLWLTDARGQRYTSELRLVAVDLSRPDAG